MKARLLFALALARPLAANTASVLATIGCRIGDICAMQSPLFGCKDLSDVKHWIDTYVDQNREAAEKYVDEQVAAGECARFQTGDKLLLVRYLGLRRLEVLLPRREPDLYHAVEVNYTSPASITRDYGAMSSTLCAIVKNEAPYLVEWALFHRMIGFDRIVVYENDSDDATPQVLERLKQAGVIDEKMSSWSNVPDSPQFRAYVDATLKCATDWIMFLDADEFLNIFSRAPVNDFLARFAPDVSSVAVNWRVFGSSGHKNFTPGPVLERFAHASAPHHAVNRHVKSFFRPRCASAVHMHAPLMVSGRSVLASGAPLTMATRGISDRLDWSVAQVNHYFGKSFEEYAGKRRRGIPRVCQNDDPEKFTKYTDELFRAHDLNYEPDHGLAWALPELKRRIAALEKA